jgi:putative PIN family toxin of toxin-antitoxin system
MKIVLDTNVLIAAFISHGTCAEILEHCVLNHTLISSKPLIEEFQNKLKTKFQFSLAEIRNAQSILKPVLQMVVPRKLQSPVCRDPDDDIVLATALTGKCDCILTGDKDLLDIKIFQGIEILLPGNFWRYEARKS